MVKAFFQELFGYSVTVWWEGDIYRHRAWTRRGALEWLAAYPRGTTAAIWAAGQLVAWRQS